MSATVYLDYNATAPVRPAVAEAMTAALALGGNASSVHSFGRAARQMIEEARAAVAALAGADPSDLVFTSGGTEANNLALKGLPGARVLASAGEHASVLQAVPGAGFLPLGADGRVDLAALEEQLSKAVAEHEGPLLLSVQWANNETGVIQPVAEIARLARSQGALFHCDAVQAAGKLPLEMAASGIDFLSLSAHKLGGPQGVGALAMAPGRHLMPLIQGGGQERSHRAGTENLPGIAGFGAAAREAAADLDDQEPLAALRDGLEADLTARAPGLRIFGAEVPRLANTSCFAVAGLSAETQVMALDLAGVAVSAGSACSSGKLEPSHVLRAMGASAEEAGSAIRVSLGWNSKPEDLAAFEKAWMALYNRARAA